MATEPILKPAAQKPNDDMAALYPRVFNISYALTGNAHAAEDLTQETFAAAYKSMPGFRGDSSVFTWLVAICRRQWAKRWRKEQRYKPVDSIEIVNENDSSRQDARSELDAALARLDERDRTVLVLFHIEELSYQQIAQAMEVPLGTIKRRIFEARRKLRLLIDKSHEV